MAVIAMTQEMATLGKDVALGVCEALGLQQVRHEVGDVVAGKMHVKKSLIRRIREGKASKIEKWAADEKTISIFTAEEVYDLAVKGNVADPRLGRHAAPEERPAHPAHPRVRPAGAAREAPHGAPGDRRRGARPARDPGRRRRARRAHGGGVRREVGRPHALRPHAQHRARADRAVRGAGAGARAEPRLPGDARLAPAPGGPGAAGPRAAALRADERTDGIAVDIQVRGGEITLAGIVVDEREKQLCRDVVQSIPGVKGVRDELRTMAGGARRFPSTRRDG